MAKYFRKNYFNQLELKVWDIAITGLTHTKFIRNLIRNSSHLHVWRERKHEIKRIGLVASGGVIFGSGLSLIAHLIH